MPKILIAECKQEVSTFNPFLSHITDFEIRTGPAILAAHRGGRMELGGALSVFDAVPDLELIPTYSASFITSGGTLAGPDFNRIAREFIEQIRAAPPVDAAYISLHGAMCAENETDPEGYLLAETRKILGDHVPIVISLDLHGILTEQMLRQIDAFTAFHTYPHVDFYETGERAARLLLRIMNGEVRPVTARVPIPALVRGDELITATGLFGQLMRSAQHPAALSAGLFIGNPFTDVPELQSYTYCITDDDPALAQQETLRLAADFWQVRDRLQARLTPLAEAVSRAQAITEGTVIFTDAADATSSGASGDSNAILRALREAGYAGRVLLPMVDAPAVEAAFAAGVGGTVQTTLGGQLDNRFQPLPISARVRLLSDGDFINESHGSVWHAGRTAVLESENITVVVTSRAVSLYDRSLFLAHGQNPPHFDLVVVKSPHCQPHFFDDWAAVNINVDAPGSTSANLPRLGHTRCPRPIYPLDGDFAYTPQVQLFRRGES